jgi:hypothetical protein
LNKYPFHGKIKKTVVKVNKVLTHEQSARSNGICMAMVSKTVKDYCDGGLDKVLTLKIDKE